MLRVVKRIEKIQRGLLRNDFPDNKKFHLVGRKRVWHAIKRYGDLGIPTVKRVNKALQGKWPCRLGNEDNGL